MSSLVTLPALKEMGKMILGVALLGIVTDLQDVRAAETRTSFIRIYESCSLTEASTQPAYEAADCKYACVAKRAASGQCAAYQWDAGSHTCRLQETLNVTASQSAQDTVGVLLASGDDVVQCSSDADCPVSQTCRVFELGCGEPQGTCMSTHDCAEILATLPSAPSGVYEILAGTTHPHSVWCDMDTDGGGWTVFLARLDGSVDFYRDLATYKQGFGDAGGEYWLGLDTLHALTSSTTTYELRADISDWTGASVYSGHASFVVGGEAENYTLSIGAFTGGEGGDGLMTTHQMQFSTWDADRDNGDTRHCAENKHGGFWYRNCISVHPTAKYYHGGAYTNTHNDGIQWRTWPAHDDAYYSMKTVTLKLRP